jgi:hypothetical protein
MIGYPHETHCTIALVSMTVLLFIIDVVRCKVENRMKSDHAEQILKSRSTKGKFRSQSCDVYGSPAGSWLKLSSRYQKLSS